MAKVFASYNKNGIVKYYVGNYLVVFNPNNIAKRIMLKDEYQLVDIFSEEKIDCKKSILASPISTTILIKK